MSGALWSVALDMYVLKIGLILLKKTWNSKNDIAAIALEVPRVLRLLPVVQLAPDARAHLVREGGDVVLAVPRLLQEDQADLQDVHVQGDRPQQPRPLDLHCDLAAIPGAAAVHLPERGRRDGLLAQLLEEEVLGPAGGLVADPGPRDPRRDGA